MAEEIKKVITIEVGKSITSIRDFRKHIEDLRGSLLVLNQDSDEYKTIAAEIAQNQEKLNEVLKVGKGNTDAAAGSYVELNNQLKALRNQYKALSEADREGDVGKNMLVNIQQLDEKLKDLDEGMGVYNRNVGNYKQAFEEAFKAMAQNIGNVNPQLGKLMQTAAQLIPLIKAASQAATTGLKGIKAGLASTGIGLLVVALGEIIANWEKISGWLRNVLGIQKELTDETKNTKKAVEEYSSILQNSLNQLQTLLNAKGFSSDYIYNQQIKILEDNVSNLNNNLYKTEDIYKRLETIRRNFRKATWAWDDNTKKWDEIHNLEALITEFNTIVQLQGDTDKTLDSSILDYDDFKKSAKNAEEVISQYAETIRTRIEDNKTQLEQIKNSYGILSQTELTEMRKRADAIGKTQEEIRKKQYQDEIENAKTRLNARMISQEEYDEYIKNAETALEADLKKIREDAWKSSSSYAQLQEDLNNIKAIQERLKNQGKDEMEILQETYEAEKALLIKYNQDTTKLDEEYWLNKLNIIHENARDVEEAINGIVEEIKNSWREAYQEELNTQELFESQAISAVSTRMVNGRTTTGDTSSDIAAERQKEDEIFMIQKAGYEARIQSHQDYLMLLDEGDSEYLDVQRQIAEEEMGLAELVYNHTATLEERKRADLQETLRIAQGMIQAYGNLGSTIAGIIADASEEGTSRWKAARITETVISTIAGAAGAFMQGMSSYPQPWGAIIGAAGAAAATATGAAEIAKIKKTQIGGSSSVSGISASSSMGASVSPLLNPDYDLQRITNLSLQSDDYLPGKTQVYVLESDIQEVGNRVQVRENNATF